jgi:hypothetical protein
VVIHLAGGFEDGRQSCLRCGVLLITCSRDEFGGVAQYPPPWPSGSWVEIEVDDGVIRSAGVTEDPWRIASDQCPVLR